MTYTDFISQFKVFTNAVTQEGLHRHHIVPRSEQTEPDNRQVYLTPAQHLWAHILYDRENGTDTAHFLISQSKITGEIHSYEDCLSFNEMDIINREINSKANSGTNHPMYGKHHTEEAKRKMSEYQKERVVSEETREKMSKAQKGKVVSEVTREKLRQSHLGKKVSEETKKKLSDSLTGKLAGENHPFYGKHLSEEHRKKLSDSHKGIEHAWLKGKPLSDDHKKKISDTLRILHSGENNPAYGRKWFNNGEVNYFGTECPEGYQPGMLKKRKAV